MCGVRKRMCAGNLPTKTKLGSRPARLTSAVCRRTISSQTSTPACFPVADSARRAMANRSVFTARFAPARTLAGSRLEFKTMLGQLVVVLSSIDRFDIPSLTSHVLQLFFSLFCRGASGQRAAERRALAQTAKRARQYGVESAPATGVRSTSAWGEEGVAFMLSTAKGVCYQPTKD